MSMKKGAYVAVFAPPADGELTSGRILRFVGPGEPGERRRLRSRERKAKRGKAKMRRRAKKRAR